MDAIRGQNLNLAGFSKATHSIRSLKQTEAKLVNWIVSEERAEVLIEESKPSPVRKHNDYSDVVAEMETRT